MTNRITVVVCVKNGEKTLDRALKSVIENKPFEVIVVDGNSSDQTIDIAKKYTDKIYFDEGKGLATARQVGADNAHGDYIAYIDSDTELPHHNILELMLEELNNNKWVAIHAQLIDPRDDKVYWEQGEDFYWRSRFNVPGERKWMGTIVCLIRRDIILKYKFDTFFIGAAEDSDFYHRIGKKGYKFGISNTTAYHYHRASFKQFCKQRFWYGKGNARALMKHKAITLLISPFGITLYGVWLCMNKRQIKYIPFYMVWTVVLFSGTVIGLIEILLRHNN